jgi:signal transduction histidine kinase
MSVAAHVVAGDYLTRQAHQQLSAYAAQLTSRPFTLFPGDRVAPGASGLGATSPALGVAVLDAGGQQLITAGRATPPAAGGGWLEVSKPVSYQAKHILFAYGAEDSSFSVTSKTRSGYAGRLVIGLDLASVGRAVDGLTVTCLRATGLAVLLATAVAAGATGALRRRRAPAAGAETHDAAERSSAAAAEVCRQLRRPLSVLAGLAEYHRGRGPLGDGDAEQTLRRVAGEAERIGELVDQLEATARAPEPENGWTAADGSGQAG